MENKKPKKKKLPPGVRERDGRFTYRYSVEVIVDGKRNRKQKETKSYGTAKEAYDAGILIEADKQRGKLVDEKTITLGQWCKRWLEDYEIEHDPREYTLYNKKTTINIIKRYFGENTRLKDITRDDYQRWLNSLKKGELSEGTIRIYHTRASIIFGDAVRKEFISNSPTTGAKIPKFNQTLQEIEGNKDIPLYLEKDQLKHFLNITRFRGSVQDYNIFVILAYTGLRIGELLALKTSDFFEEERYLSITKTISSHGNVKEFNLGPPKNKSSIRKVSVGDTVIKAVKSQLSWRSKKQLEGCVMLDEDFLFWSTKYPGFPPTRYAVGDRFKKLLQLAELPTALHTHSLRHTHVTLLAEAGEDLAVIQDRLGHKNDEITRLIYLHVTDQQKKLVPDRFEKLMNS